MICLSSCFYITGVEEGNGSFTSSGVGAAVGFISCIAYVTGYSGAWG